jgi:tetratricopeptide (TPR) repeat protein
VTDTQSKAASPARETVGTRLAAKRAAKSARKASQRGTTNPAAEVAKSVQEVNAWIDAHGSKIWIALGAVVVLVVAWLGLSAYAEKRDRAGGDLLHTAVTTSEGLVVTPDETAPEDPIVPIFSSAKERDEKALQQFRDVEKQFPNSRAARYAQLGEANTLVALGKPADATTVFTKLLGEQTDDTFLRSRALEGSGYALEAEKKYAEAGKRFEELSKLQNGSFRVIGDYHRARMLVAQGQRDEARKLLEALNKSQEDKPEKADAPGDRFESATQSAQTLLAELGGKPAEKSSGGGAHGGISQSVLDSLRKQLGSQNK